MASEYNGTACAGLIVNQGTPRDVGVSRRRLNGLLSYPQSQAQLRYRDMPQSQGCREGVSAGHASLAVPPADAEDRVMQFLSPSGSRRQAVFSGWRPGMKLEGRTPEKVSQRELPSPSNGFRREMFENSIPRKIDSPQAAGFEGGTAKTPPRSLVDFGLEASRSAAPPTPHACAPVIRPLHPSALQEASTTICSIDARLCPEQYKEYMKNRDADGTPSWRDCRRTRSALQGCNGKFGGGTTYVQGGYIKNTRSSETKGECEMELQNHQNLILPLRIDPGRLKILDLCNKPHLSDLPTEKSIFPVCQNNKTTGRIKNFRVWQIWKIKLGFPMAPKKCTWQSYTLRSAGRRGEPCVRT